MMRKMAAIASLFSGPIIVILGSTGVGKSKLGIELAKRINGEVVSADSMQVYKGLDIITAKVTQAEQQECKHHMIDVVSPLSKFNVVDFRNMALPIVSDIESRNKIPIVVGGTNYYIESLMWEILLEDTEIKEKSNDHPPSDTTEYHEKFEIGSKVKETTPVISASDKSETCLLIANGDYECLKIIDPIAASTVHPNDHRKVKRKLEISQMKGQSATELYGKQRDKEGSDHLGGPLRFKNALVFWLHCDHDILKERLHKRVDDMLKNGLVEEISDFYTKYEKDVINKHPNIEPYTEGIFQAIGFKEFRDFLTNKSDDAMASKKLLNEGIDALKRVTVRYSRKQTTWIRNRFLKRPEQSSPNVYQLDASCLDEWHETVLKPALQTTKEFLNSESISLKHMQRISKDPDEDAHRHHICEVCDDKLIVGDATWNAHCSSRKHKKRASKKRKLKETDS